MQSGQARSQPELQIHFLNVRFGFGDVIFCLPRLLSCSGSFPFTAVRDLLFCTPSMMK